MNDEHLAMPIAPCKDCKYRSAECRKNCIAWAAYVAIRNMVYERRAKESAAENDAFMASRASKYCRKTDAKKKQKGGIGR